jgi:hypothetical protein
MTSIERAASLAAMVVWVVGCVGQSEDSGDLATVRDAIYGWGATDAMVTTSPFVAAVGQLRAPFVDDAGNDGAHICSGTLVTPRHVVSAAHCFFHDEPTTTFRLPGMDIPVESVQVPSFAPHATWGANDLAVVNLAIDVPRWLASPTPMYLGNPADIPRTGYIVGWGGTVRYDSDAGAGTRRTGMVAPRWYHDRCGDLCEANCNTTPYWVVGDLDPTNHAMFASGDSGGGLFGLVNNEWTLIGVVSGWFRYDYWCNSEEGQVAASLGGVGSVVADWLREATAYEPQDLTDAFELDDVALFAREALDIHDRAATMNPDGSYASVALDNASGWIGPRGSFSPAQVGVDAHVGSAWIANNLDVWDRGAIHGPAAVEGLAHLGNDVTIQSLVEHTRVGMPSMLFGGECVNVPQTACTSVALEPDQVFDMSSKQGCYVPELIVKSRARAVFPAGSTFYIGRVVVEPEGTLEFHTHADGLPSPVRVAVVHELSFKGRVVDVEPDGQGHIFFGVIGQQRVGVESPFDAVLVAPNAEVDINASGKSMRGAFYARKLVLHQATQVVRSPFRHEWWPMACGTRSGYDSVYW